MRHFLLTLTLLFLGNFASAAPCGPSNSGEHAIETEGEAAIFKGDKAAAKETAIKAAQRSAVEQVVGVMVSSETKTQNYQLIEDKILTKSSGFIKCYKVISAKAKGKSMTVNISAVVTQGGLKSAIEGLGVLVKCKANPRMMVLVGEKLEKDDKFRFWWKDEGASRYSESKIIEYFLDKEFQLVDQKSLKDLDLGDGSNKTLAEQGKKVGAELIVSGRMEGFAMGNAMANTNMKSGQASMEMRIIDPNTGRVLATTSAMGGSLFVNQTIAIRKAMEKASKKASKKLLAKVMKLWQKECFRQNSVEMTVKGLKYSELQRFRNIVKRTFRGIFAINERRAKDNLGTWELKLSGSVNTLAAELSDSSFEGRSIEIQEKTPSTLIIAIKKKK